MPDNSNSHKGNILATLQRFVDRQTHGRSYPITVPSEMRIRDVPMCMDIGLVFDHLIFTYMRNQQIPIPVANALYTLGFGASPLLAEKAPDLAPSLAMTIIAQSYSKAQADRRVKVADIIAQEAAKEGVPQEKIAELIAASELFMSKAAERSFQRTISGLLASGSGGRQGQELVDAFATRPTASFSLFRTAYKLLTEIYSMLVVQTPLETIAAKLPAALDDREYLQYFRVGSGMSSNTLAVASSSLYTLFEMHTGDSRRVAKPGTIVTPKSSSASRRSTKKGDEVVIEKSALPKVQAIREDNTTDAMKTLFGYPPGAADQPPIDQFKYWRVETAFAESLDMLDVLAAVHFMDKQAFGLPEFDIDILSAIDLTVYSGLPLSLPKLPVDPGTTLWEDDRIKSFLGYAVLREVLGMRGGSMVTAILGYLNKYKLTDNNVQSFVEIQMHINIAAAIVGAFFRLRNSFYDMAFDTKLPYSLRSTREAWGPGTAYTGVYHQEAYQRYISLYSKVLSNLSEQVAIEGTPGSIFHPSIVREFSTLFDVSELSKLTSSLVPYPHAYFDGTTLTERRQLIALINGVPSTMAMNPGDVVGAGSATTAWSRLQGLTSRFEVVHGFSEQIVEDVTGIGGLFRYMPLEMLRSYSAAGRASMVMDRSARMPDGFIVSQFLIRSMKNIMYGLENQAYSLAQLGLVVKHDEVLQSRTDLVDIVHSRYVTDVIVPTVSVTVQPNSKDANDETRFISLAEILRSTAFIDTGEASLVFIYDRRNCLFAEDCLAISEPVSAPAPIFSLMTTEDGTIMDLTSLLEPPVSGAPNGSALEINRTYILGTTPTEKVEFGGTRKAENSEKVKVNPVDSKPATISNNMSSNKPTADSADGGDEAAEESKES